LRRENERQPTLAEAVAKLRRCSDLFRSKGVRRLAVFGSVARGEAGPQSDIDIAVAYEPGRDVDLADWRTLRPDVRTAVDREMIDVL
jgi:predicted nucleotidyltransferase